MAISAQLLSGTVTFLYTDIEGSAHLWEREPEPMRQALARHDAILRQAVEAQHGQVYKVIGDALQAAFARGLTAVTGAWAPNGIRITAVIRFVVEHTSDTMQRLTDFNWFGRWLMQFQTHGTFSWEGAHPG